MNVRIAKLTDEIHLREAQRLESEKIARTNLLQSRTRSQLGEIPEHVLKLFKQPEIGEVMEAGAHRLKKIDLYDYAVKTYAPSYHTARHLKLGKLLLIAGESDELVTALAKITKAIGNKGDGVLTLENFLDYALGGTTTQYQKFFRNIETFNVTQKQLDEAAEIAAKSTTPEKAAQLFYDEIVKAADTNKVFTRNQLESIPVVNNNDQKRMIADQIEENRRIKEELDGGSKENGNLDESSLDVVNEVEIDLSKMFFSEIGKELPDNWNVFLSETQIEFAVKLKQFRGNNDLTFNPKLRGGEGQLFESPLTGNLVLKRWFASRIIDMPESIRLLKDAEKLINSNSNLIKHMDIVKVEEQGADWIIRGFNKKSVPLKDVVSSSTIASQTRQAAIDVLSTQEDKIAQNILKKLNKNSANLHWSPTDNKILIIDMQ